MTASHVGAWWCIHWLKANRAPTKSTSTARYPAERNSDRSKQCAGIALRREPIVKGGFSVGALASTLTLVLPRVILIEGLQAGICGAALLFWCRLARRSETARSLDLGAAKT